MTHWTEFLRGHNGGLEINRLVGFIGGLAYIVSAIWFEALNTDDFDVTAWCLAFPSGLAVIAGGTAGAVALKDRQVATAKVIETTGSKPADPPAPAPKVQPELAEATDASGEGMPSYAL